jgi:hypothetical protein
MRRRTISIAIFDSGLLRARPANTNSPVLTFSICRRIATAREANGALNLFHIAAAFVVQYATGVVLQYWTPQAGHYPEIAYQTAFALNLALQVVAWIWFMLPRVETGVRKY